MERMPRSTAIDLVIPTPLAPLELSLSAGARLSDEAFTEVSRANPDLRLERTSEGAIVVIPPAGGETSRRNLLLAVAVARWAESDGTGVVFDSSGGFRLPNGAIRSPDVAWVQRAHLAAVPQSEKALLLPLCPDFAVELCSPTDRLDDVERKMDEYIANGARLGWLIEPATRSVFVYRPGRSPEVLHSPKTLSGNPDLSGLTVSLTEIWEPDL
jgi:Uma2 family endonuclease